MVQRNGPTWRRLNGSPRIHIAREKDLRLGSSRKVRLASRVRSKSREACHKPRDKAGVAAIWAPTHLYAPVPAEDAAAQPPGGQGRHRRHGRRLASPPRRPDIGRNRHRAHHRHSPARDLQPGAGAAITVFLVISGFLAAGGFGLAAISTLSWIYRYVTGKKPPGAEQLDTARDKLASKAREMKEMAEQYTTGSQTS
ncbi:Oleosin [Sesamum angolense]|uniref:Oleosin n=1 Tax=Sesamum angolense TaxID=2727404 RepID=A0AAE1W0L1_9LAMI|nr:Oleosin [Sesamum angolense]